MKIRFFFPLIFLILSSNVMFSQGSFSGDLMLNNNFFMRDSLRGALGIPHYDNSLKSTDSWLQLMYMNDGLEIGARLDMYYNSNLHIPTQVFSSSGIGMLYIRKNIKKLTITGGNIYDQIGSGVVFRAFEDRGLGIDNSLFGVHLKYDLSENWSIYGMSGKQKYRFELYEPIITASKMEGYLKLGEDLQIVPGLGVMNRTLDEASMASVVTQINSYDLEDRFYPKYNVYAGSFYNTTTYKNITWYLEYALKTSEAIKDETNNLSNRNGSLLYTTLGYSKKGIGVIGQYKRTENFSLRVSPDMVLLNGMINFLPPLTRQNTYRLTSRYAAMALPLGEDAFQLDLVMKPRKGLNIDINFPMLMI